MNRPAGLVAAVIAACASLGACKKPEENKFAIVGRSTREVCGYRVDIEEFHTARTGDLVTQYKFYDFLTRDFLRQHNTGGMYNLKIYYPHTDQVGEDTLVQRWAGDSGKTWSYWGTEGYNLVVVAALHSSNCFELKTALDALVNNLTPPPFPTLP